MKKKRIFEQFRGEEPVLGWIAIILFFCIACDFSSKNDQTIEIEQTKQSSKPTISEMATFWGGFCGSHLFCVSFSCPLSTSYFLSLYLFSLIFSIAPPPACCALGRLKNVLTDNKPRTKKEGKKRDNTLEIFLFLFL